MSEINLFENILWGIDVKTLSLRSIVADNENKNL